jgi:TolB-like protein/Flp pilus assembly protein TadD
VEEEAETATMTPAGTVAGTVMGTMGYMSPEQLRGEPSDARSDIFALGCVLYEMLSGRTAFLRNSTAETTAAILKEEPPSLSDSGTTLPAELERTIRRCLEKSPEARFQSASDLAYNLRSIPTDQATRPAPSREVPSSGQRRRLLWIAAAAMTVLVAAVAVWVQRSPPVEELLEVPIPRIVVLPFENLGPPEDEYFADGMTEEIISRLSAVGGLQVISRTSAMYYKGRTVPLKQIGVQYALEGTVRWERAGEGYGRVRITPQLINVTDDSHLWSDRYDRAMESVFEVQSDIAEQVVAQLHVSLLEPEEIALHARPTDNLKAYELYLRAWHHSSTNDLEEEQIAVIGAQRAVELDPDFAVAWAFLSRRHSWIYFRGWDRNPERRTAARKAVDRALDIDPKLTDGFVTMGLYFYWCHRDYDRALEEFAKALAVRPKFTMAIEGRAWVLRRLGQWEESTRLLESAFDASPRDVLIARNLSDSFKFLRDLRRAVEYADLAISLEPGNLDGYSHKIDAFYYQGRLHDARTVFEEVPISSPLLQLKRIDLEIAERRFEEALARIAETPEAVYEQAWGAGAAGHRAQDECACYFFLGDQRGVQEACGRARVTLEEKTHEYPDNSGFHGSLGLTYAYLSRNDDAIREGERAVALMPVSEDALVGPIILQNLTAIYSLVGEREVALDQIEYLLSIPSQLTVGWLRVHPYWDPFRDHPRFQALLEEYDTE